MTFAGGFSPAGDHRTVAGKRPLRLDLGRGGQLDLYYVENWSLIQDLMIVWRTIWAVFKGSGAY